MIKFVISLRLIKTGCEMYAIVSFPSKYMGALLVLP